jgi:hypothetical protein
MWRKLYFMYGQFSTTIQQKIDVYAQLPDHTSWLLQVCADTAEPATLARETRALVAAALYLAATPLLLTLEPPAPAVVLPVGLNWQSAASWLLGEPLEVKP